MRGARASICERMGVEIKLVRVCTFRQWVRLKCSCARLYKSYEKNVEQEWEMPLCLHTVLVMSLRGL